jgi:hypothetical protein
MADMISLKKVVSRLEMWELGILPLKLEYIKRFCVAYTRRWRELIVYANAASLIFFYKKPVYIVEEEILRKTPQVHS